MRSKKLFIIIGISVLVCVLAYCIWKIFVAYDKSSNDTKQILYREIEWGVPNIALQEAKKSANQLPESSKQYINAELGISFDYPQDLIVSDLIEPVVIEEEESLQYTILVQNASKNIGIQISAFPFSDPLNTLTEDRIEKDLGINISKYSIINIGKNHDIEAVTFLIGNSVLYREVWFIHDAMLFEIKAYQSSEPIIAALLKTLHINE